MGWDRDDLLARTDLRVLLTSIGGEPSRSGPSARWRCPAADHPDEHPSVSVFTDRRGVERWRCWSGGHAGTAIDVILAARPGITMRAARDDLGARAGLTSGIVDRAPPRTRPVERVPVPLHESVLEYIDACEKLLWKPAGRTVREYLLNTRGLDADVLRLNRVGADPGPSVVTRAPGLPRGGGAAVFPVHGIEGDVRYVQARYLEPGERGKYANPAAWLGDNPKVAFVRTPHVRMRDVVVVREGLPDAYQSAANGCIAAALLGATCVDPGAAQELQRFARGRRLEVSLDDDPAGVPLSRDSMVLNAER